MHESGQGYVKERRFDVSDFRKKMDVEAVKAFISEQSPTTRIYVGGDSERHKIGGVWYADYAVCVVVHFDGCRGGRLFGEVTRERDYHDKKGAGRVRLMNEVYKIAEMWNRIKDAIGDREFEIHLDINSKKGTGSNAVMDEAIGYIRGTCNVIPMIKPDSPAASFCADRFAEIKQREAAAQRGADPDKLTAARLKRKRKTAA